MSSQIYIPINSPISNYVTGIWETSTEISREIILPQGVVEMVFNLADPMQGILPHKESVIKAPDFFLQGWNTHVVDVKYAGKQHLFGIRLQPYMVKQLTGILPSECKNILIDLSLIQPKFRSLWHMLTEAKSFQQRVAIIERELPVLSNNGCARTQHFCDVFTTESMLPVQSIDELAKEICYSSRQLNRKAQSIFGVSAEELVTYKKFNTAVHLMHRKTKSLTEIAYGAGFYDQAHFCRIFKNYTGLTAKEYQSQKSDLPFHIFS